MKILLYETADHGHGPVILRYTIKSLDSMGIQWAQEATEYNRQPHLLVSRARNEKCDIIYVLTADGSPLFVWFLSLLARPFGIRVICTYYLFNNLAEGWKSWVWRLLFATGFIERVHISDAKILSGRGRYPRQSRYLPDPWDPAEFPEWPQEAAREHLGLPSKATIFLMFGVLDERKGADVFLRASLDFIEKWQDKPVVFFLAGRMSPAVHKVFDTCQKTAKSREIWNGRNQHILEKDVSAVFYASDFLVCPYPGYFKVSSGSVTRALAAGRPVIAPSHGVNAELVRSNACGLTFITESVFSLSNAFHEAQKMKQHDFDKWKQMSETARKLSVDRRLDVYGKYLHSSLAGLIS